MPPSTMCLTPILLPFSNRYGAIHTALMQADYLVLDVFNSAPNPMRPKPIINILTGSEILSSTLFSGMVIGMEPLTQNSITKTSPPNIKVNLSLLTISAPPEAHVAASTVQFGIKNY